MTVLVALSMVVIMAATALSFDIGHLVSVNRSMQSVADAAALDTAATLDGGFAGATDAASSTGQTLAQFADAEAAASAIRNGFNPTGVNVLTVQLGSYSLTGGFHPLANADTTTPPNSVKVTAQTKTTYDFEPGNGSSTRSSTAVRAFCSSTNPSCTSCPTTQPTLCAVSGFTIGSYAASLDTTQSAFLNSLLTQSLGLGSANLQAVSYQGLAASNITLNNLLTANTGVGTLNNLLSTAVSPSTLLGYLANAIGATSGADPLGSAEASVQTIGQTTSTTKVALCKLISLSGSAPCNATNPSAAASTELNALDFVRLVAEAANGSNALSFNGGAGLGLITVSGNLISPIAVAPPGPATNASGQHPVKATDQQGNLQLSVNTGLVSVNLVVQAATSTGTLTSITCAPTMASTQTSIGVSSTAAVITPTIGVSILGIFGSVPALPVSVGANSATLTFNGPFNAQNTQSTGSTEPSITIAPSGVVTGAVSAVLSPVLSLLNPLVSPLLAALGVDLGGATVANNTLTCGMPSLVG